MPAGSGLPALGEELDLLVAAAEAAATIAMAFHGRTPRNWTKANNSPVSEADIAVEQMLEARLRRDRPQYGWLSEETEDEGSRLSAPRTFIVDPIDGTRDFIAGGRDWSIPIALVEDGRPIVAVLIAPSRDERYRAITGRGAQRNGRPIQVSGRDALDDASIAAPRRMFTSEGGALAGLRTPFFASLAYRLARVADGRLDAAAIKPNARDWDLAAADLLVHEAGGRLSDLAGAVPRYDRAETSHQAMIAATPALVVSLMRLVEAAGRAGADEDSLPKGDDAAHGQRGEHQAGP